ncbi:hypothetical protein MN116_003966 [Schistosoma mekongi]|uniref:Phosphoglucomutase n=1 Tax=Schistosoma mekongi TaxID=38744 RepID=A0AAE1ZF90_SCHME|nr:hypothetical protein MN116_003966 [Schistosoma mekongi]
MDEKLAETFQEWMRYDKNENTRSQIQLLKEKGSWDELRKILLDRMAFGTAGLRAKMGPGYSQMNDLTIIQTTQGLLKYSLKTFPNLMSDGIIVGYDARHNSKKWALIVANIFLNANCKVYLFRDAFPTPMVAFGVKLFKTALGVMITASHNPKDDNGYKVYWSNGCQIISPHDKGISGCILESLIPLETSWSIDTVETNPLCLDPMPKLLKTYCRLQKGRLCFTESENSKCQIPFVYTPMHGVGWEAVKTLVSYFGFPPLEPVPEQIIPDPDFPTVDYPNPEEGRSALNLAIKHAEFVKSTIIFANDPDADRLAVAEKQTSGQWKMFNGNELGALFGWWLSLEWRIHNPQVTPSSVAVLSSTVSSKILKTIAEHEGFRFEETLTGFKWLGNRACDLESQNIKTIFAFEEAIGFMCGDVVWDKDGVGALAVMAEMASYVYHERKLLSEQLVEIYNIYGQHISNNGYYFCYEPEKIVKMFNRLRNWPNEPNPKGYPQKVGRFRITGIRDLTVGYDDHYPNFKPVLPVSASSQLITFDFDNGATLTLRTSGTEPKIKYYSELRSKPGSGTSVESLTNELKELVNNMIEEFYEPEKNGFLPRVD